MDFGSLNEYSIDKTPCGAAFVLKEDQIDDLVVMGRVIWSTELEMFYKSLN